MAKTLKSLSNLSSNLVNEILQASQTMDFEKGTEILKEGQYIKVIPIVIEGLIKVFSSFSDREMLLYYIKPGESCIMSFAASLKNEPSKIYAVTEENTKIILLPVAELSRLMKQFPEMNHLFFQQYNLRYTEMLDSMNQLLFSKLDKRLMDYLKKKMLLTKKNPIKITHAQIASELGTVREVISRLIKKLESEGKVKQFTNSIEILEL